MERRNIKLLEIKFPLFYKNNLIIVFKHYFLPELELKIQNSFRIYYKERNVVILELANKIRAHGGSERIGMMEKWNNGVLPIANANCYWVLGTGKLKFEI